MALKYENKFKVGERIRSYDWETAPGRKPCFIEGEILSINPPHLHHKAYEILVDRDVFNGREQTRRVGIKFYVPMEVAFGEFDERIIYVGQGSLLWKGNTSLDS